MSNKTSGRNKKDSSVRRGGTTTKPTQSQKQYSDAAMEQDGYMDQHSYMTSHNHGNNHHHGNHHHHGSHHHHGPRQMQMDEQLIRSIQASKQMVYKVFENVIGALEEIESRESKARKQKTLPKSKIQYADQSMRNDLDVQRQLETQLVLFEAQMVSCAPEIKEAVRQELTEVTLKWIGARQENELENGAVDGYTGHLLRILTEGKTEHPEVFNQVPDISEEQLKENFGKVMVGEHERKKLDKDFRDDPEKQAQLSEIRGTSAAEGAERVSETDPGMDVEEYKDEQSMR